MEARKVFNALNGDEIKKLILEEVKRNLDNDGMFRINLTYPIVSWNWKLTVSAYPLDPPQFHREVEGAVEQGGFEAPPEQEPIIRLIGEESRVDMPDLSREGAGLPDPEEDSPFARQQPGRVARRPVVRSAGGAEGFKE